MNMKLYFTFLTLAFLFPLLLGGGSGSAAIGVGVKKQKKDAPKARRCDSITPEHRVTIPIPRLFSETKFSYTDTATRPIFLIPIPIPRL